MLYCFIYLLIIFCDNVDESTALNKANSVSVRCAVGCKVIASEMRQENKIVIFLDYNTMKRKKQLQDQRMRWLYLRVRTIYCGHSWLSNGCLYKVDLRATGYILDEFRAYTTSA